MKNLSPRVEFNGENFNLFSWTFAMDCWSFSLPAGRAFSCPSATDNLPESICGSCYAMSGNYLFSNVQKTQHARFAWLKYELEYNFDGFVEFMVKSIALVTGGNGYFRWHDSGDIFSIRYAEALVEICRKLPNIRFWVPTRTSDAAGRDKTFQTLMNLKNVALRKSAIFPNTEAKTEVFSLKSAVISKDYSLKGYLVCPKSKNHTSCATEKCRKCWHKTVKKVAYIYHGYKITDKIKERQKLYVLPS